MHYIGHERIFFPKVCFPLRRRKYFWIDFPRQLRLRRMERIDHGTEQPKNIPYR
jgi:hypothetical protein